MSVSVVRCFLNVWFLSSIDVWTMDILRSLMSLDQHTCSCSLDETQVYTIDVFVNSVNPRVCPLTWRKWCTKVQSNIRNMLDDKMNYVFCDDRHSHREESRFGWHTGGPDWDRKSRTLIFSPQTDTTLMTSMTPSYRRTSLTRRWQGPTVIRL